MSTAVKTAANLHSVSDDLAVTMFADRRNRLYSTFKAVERMSRTGRDQLKGFVVLIAANLALCHNSSSIVAANFTHTRH